MHTIPFLDSIQWFFLSLFGRHIPKSRLLWGGFHPLRGGDITQLQVYQPSTGISWPHVARILALSFFTSKRKGL